MAQDTEWTPVSHDTCDQVAGPFYHGTRADLAVGELLSAGFRSNYRDSVVMNHIYFTTIAKGAGLAAEMARGEGRPRVYVVEPTGPFEDDPNVTNKKFPEPDAVVSECAAVAGGWGDCGVGALRRGVRSAVEGVCCFGEWGDHQLRAGPTANLCSALTSCPKQSLNGRASVLKLGST